MTLVPAGGGTAAARHWDGVYQRTGPTALSWYQPKAAESLELIEMTGIMPGDAVIDVGGGASTLVDALLDARYEDLSVLDISPAGMRSAQERLRDSATHVQWLHEDLLLWQPQRRYQLWHDRAVFHFLVDPGDRARYRCLIMNAVRPGGFVVIGTFAANGPQHCSGLPVCRYNPEELQAELGDNLELVASRRVFHSTPTGLAQPFTWLVLRVHPGRRWGQIAEHGRADPI